jgi:hypothetical protein
MTMCQGRWAWAIAPVGNCVGIAPIFRWGIWFFNFQNMGIWFF